MSLVEHPSYGGAIPDIPFFLEQQDCFEALSSAVGYNVAITLGAERPPSSPWLSEGVSEVVVQLGLGQKLMCFGHCSSILWLLGQARFEAGLDGKGRVPNLDPVRTIAGHTVWS